MASSAMIETVARMLFEEMYSGLKWEKDVAPSSKDRFSAIADRLITVIENFREQPDSSTDWKLVLPKTGNIYWQNSRGDKIEMEPADGQ